MQELIIDPSSSTEVIKKDSVTDFPVEPAAAVQRSMERYWLLAIKNGTVHAFDQDGIYAVRCKGVPQVFNTVYRIKPADTEDEEAIQIQTVQAFYKEIPHCWYVDTKLASGTLMTSLRMKGYTEYARYKGMFAVLAEMEYSHQLPEGCQVKPVKSGKDFESWLVPVRCAFEWAHDEAQNYLSIMKAAKGNCEIEFQHYVVYRRKPGELKGRPIASTSLVLDKSTEQVGVWNCATIKSERRQGIMAGLLRHGLFHAHEKGFKTALLHATELGEHSYSKIGFEACSTYMVFSSPTAI